MSKFNHYAVKANETAKKALDELEAAYRAVKDAEQTARQYPQQTSGRIVDAEYLARSARAAADLAEAQNKLKQKKASMGDVGRKLQTIRQQLKNELEAAYCADPKAIDSGTMALLSSGILSTSEYKRLADDAQKAGNYTMARLIAKAAADAAERCSADDARRQELQAVAVSVGDDPVAGKLGLFDVVVSGFEHCVNNHHMIQSWPEFTARSVEAL